MSYLSEENFLPERRERERERKERDLCFFTYENIIFYLGCQQVPFHKKAGWEVGKKGEFFSRRWIGGEGVRKNERRMGKRREREG